MVKQANYSIIWDRNALEHFKEILDFLSKQSPQSPIIVKEGVLSQLEGLKKNPLIFEIDKLKAEIDTLTKSNN